MPAKVKKAEILPIKQSKMVAAIDMRLNRSMKLREIAVALKLSIPTISRIVKLYITDPIVFVDGLKQVTYHNKTFEKAASEAIHGTALTNASILTNKDKLCDFLRPYVKEKDQLSNWQLFSRAKKELQLVKQKPRIDRSSATKKKHPMQIMMADLTLLKLFHCDRTMMTFDSSTILNDKLGLECWTLQGLRSELPGTLRPAGLHLMMVLTSEGLGSIQHLKEGVKEITARQILMWSVRKIMTSRGNLPPIRYLFLDNSLLNLACKFFGGQFYNALNYI